MTITPGIAKRLKAFIAEVITSEEQNMESACDDMEIEGKFLLQKLEPRKTPRKTWAKKAPEPSRAEEVSPLLEEAKERANGRCENCNFGPGVSLAMDHWLGGSGRRRKMEALETVWMLCVHCNWDRTNNLPGAAHWNDRFERFCMAHGYPFVAHIEHQQLRAQHQEKSQP